MKNKLFAGLSLPGSKSIMNQRTNGSTYGPTDRPTHPCIEGWLGTKNHFNCLSVFVWNEPLIKWNNMGSNHFQSCIIGMFICRGQLQYYVND